jgi:hypothetical protein
MKRVSSILVASLFALGAAVPAFAWTNHTSNANQPTEIVAGAGIHKVAMASEEGSSEGSAQPDQPSEPQQPPSSDDGGE